jgi:hypothetical protein
MKKPISIRLKQVSLDLVDGLAATNGWTRTVAIEHLIDEALTRRGLLIGEKAPDTLKAGDVHFRHTRPMLGNYDDEA